MDKPVLTAKAIFDRAHEITALEERRAFLDEACGDNSQLRRQVEALLQAYDDGGSFLDKPVAAAVPLDRVATKKWGDPDDQPSVPIEGVGSRIKQYDKQYKLLQKIGEGGMGVVYMAEQQEPVRRMVAFKVIKAGMDTAQIVARFEAERQALALMDHPNIAKVLDAGTTPSGRPYFVMELVKGVPITKYCDEQRLSPRQRLELFVPVCQAIQHAHQKGIIHRDIKPSNVLVAGYDGKPMPKVIDFGVAKATGAKLTERTLFTGFGGLIGTFEYMSPEQAEFNALDIDTRSDVYSLGVLLYELLTGTTPLTRQRLKDAAILEVLRMIREEDPPRPSTRLSESKETLASVSAQRHSEPVGLVKAVRGEVDWIVMKALEKDRTRRYETANALARDIQRHLTEEPVEACPPSARYRLRKLAWKYRRGLATAAALMSFVVVAAVVSTFLAVWALRAEKEMVTERNRAWDAEAEATTERNRALEAEAGAKTQRDRAFKAEEDTKMVLDWVRDKVLTAARPKDSQGGLGEKVTLREAVDNAKKDIAVSFKDRPLVEATIRNILGMTDLYIGRPKLAVPQHRRELALREDQLGSDHPDTIRSRISLALAHRAAGETAEALDLFERNLRLAEAKLGPDHPLTLICLNNLATAYSDARRNDDAIRLYEQTLKQMEAKPGPEDPKTILLRFNLATEYLKARRFYQAIPLLEQTLRQMQAKFEPFHPHTLKNRSHLASAYLDTGRIAAAVLLFEETLKQMEANLGPHHPDTLGTRNGLAEAYDRAGLYAKAEPLCRVNLEQTLKRFAAGHPAIAAKQMSLGRNLLRQHKYADAESLLRDCLKVRQAKQPDSWATFYAQSLLGAVLAGQRKYLDAEPLLLSGYQGMKEREAKIPPQIKNCLNDALQHLVQLYEATGKKDQADKWRKKLADLRQSETKVAQSKDE